MADRDTKNQPGWRIPRGSDCPFDGGRHSHLSSVRRPCCFCFVVFLFVSLLLKTHVNRPDVVAIATSSPRAADAGKGFLQFNPPGNLPIRACWWKMIPRDAQQQCLAHLKSHLVLFAWRSCPFPLWKWHLSQRGQQMEPNNSS